jgi:hypothetical protein
MMKLFQIALSASDVAQVNKGNVELPIYKAHCDALILGKFPGKGFYTNVADIETTDLDHAFHIGNMGPEEKIVRHAPMHSVSVGDVLVTSFGVDFMVKSVCFDELDIWEVA